MDSTPPCIFSVSKRTENKQLLVFRVTPFGPFRIVVNLVVNNKYNQKHDAMECFCLKTIDLTVAPWKFDFPENKQLFVFRVTPFGPFRIVVNLVVNNKYNQKHDAMECFCLKTIDLTVAPWKFDFPYLPLTPRFTGKYLFLEYQISARHLSAGSSSTETLYCRAGTICH